MNMIVGMVKHVSIETPVQEDLSIEPVNVELISMGLLLLNFIRFSWMVGESFNQSSTR